MNVTELARRLKIPSKELLEILPAVGFDIGRRAIKIDNRQAQRIVEQWPRLYAKYKESIDEEKEEEILAEEIPAEQKQVTIPQTVRVKDFADMLKLPLPKVMAELMKNGVLSSMNEEIDFDTAAIVGEELGYEILSGSSKGEENEKTTSEKLETLLTEDDKAKLESRPPVIVIMGHVDHGKTKLLDAIRTTNVVAGESGGITQHIGAYQVKKNNKLITFIDTPGHEAFTTMRSRGARVADIAILVIAADDSIQPQTKESIKIIKSAGLPMIVAINKIDKPDANPEKVKQDLASLNLTPEEWGGSTIIVPISAKEGTGLDDLLEMVLLVAETEKDQILANPNKSAVGTIIESHVNPGEGPVATILVQSGTLKTGDQVEVAGTFYGRIRVMKDYNNKNIDSVGPSAPVKILGLKAAPSVGDILQVTSTGGKNKKVKKYELRQQAVAYSKLAEVSENDSKDLKPLNIVLKADVLGSLEAIIASLTKLEHPEVFLNIVSKGLGNITEGDINRAEASQAIIIGFHTKPSQQVENLAKEKKVTIELYEVIYKLIEEVKAKLEQLLSPEVIKTELGKLKVLAVFNKADKSMVIGGSVTKGKIISGAKVNVLRDKKIMAKGVVTQVQVNKVDVNEATAGQECGLKYEGKTVITEGDTLEVYQEEIKDKKLDS
ncbi:MAG: translation initiation factor IF-2 [Parcubacteria group bacterium]|nr:translation initiation factor IF-2 [Parcubacteria group bacterium]|tara:strand:+ start:47 stop:2038 length:1992 start_codon:yes stop_codon:yes gene_type:complete